MHRFLFALLIALLPATSALAQDWAKARLDKSPRHRELVKVKQGQREVNSFLVFPEVKDKATAVLVIHEIFGLTDWVRNVADQLAEAGYIAIAPDLLSGMGPKGGGTEELEGQNAVMRPIRDLPPDQITADLDASANYVAKTSAFCARPWRRDTRVSTGTRPKRNWTIGSIGWRRRWTGP